jgi:hypothetical protein
MRGLIGCLMVLGWGSPAVAQEQGWRLYSGEMALDVRGSVHLDQEYDYLSVRTTDPSRPEIRFSCSDQHGLKVTILFEPAESRQPYPKRIKYKARRGSLTIDNRKTVHVMWTHVKDTRTIQNRQPETARMLFNAVIQATDFEVKEPLKKKVRIEFPPVDDGFRAFSKSCHVTGGS